MGHPVPRKVTVVFSKWCSKVWWQSDYFLQQYFTFLLFFLFSKPKALFSSLPLFKCKDITKTLGHLLLLDNEEAQRPRGVERRTSLLRGWASWRVGSEFRNKTWAAAIATYCLGVNGTYGKKWEVSLLWRLQHLQACRSGQMAKSNRLTAGTPIPGPQTASQPYKDPASVPKVKASSRNTLPFSKHIGSESFISYLPKGQLGAQEEAWNCEVLRTHMKPVFAPYCLCDQWVN